MKKRYIIAHRPDLNAGQKLFLMIVNPHVLVILITICVMFYFLK